ncbi:hypothetical protein G9A89_019295 [Geosiphon pyriformis]|nr:hypothetical protein G9A89_019295 [Geosiphon pyriformis]
MKKQWSGKFDPKWDEPFHIEKILENGAYKLKWDNKILAKAAHIQPDEIPQDLEPIIIIEPNT